MPGSAVEPAAYAEAVRAVIERTVGSIDPRFGLSTVREWGRNGTLPRVKLGRHVRFVRRQIERVILADDREIE